MHLFMSFTRFVSDYASAECDDTSDKQRRSSIFQTKALPSIDLFEFDSLVLGTVGIFCDELLHIRVAWLDMKIKIRHLCFDEISIHMQSFDPICLFSICSGRTLASNAYLINYLWIKYAWRFCFERMHKYPIPRSMLRFNENHPNENVGVFFSSCDFALHRMRIKANEF